MEAMEPSVQTAPSAESGSSEAPPQIDRSDVETIARAGLATREGLRRTEGNQPRSLGDLLQSAMANAVVNDAEGRRAEALQEKIARRSRSIDFWNMSGVPIKFRGVPRDPDFSSIPERIELADENGRPVSHEVRIPYSKAFGKLVALEHIRGGAVVALLGDRGPGKTWMACCLVKRFCAAARFGMYAEALDYFVNLRATYGDRGVGTELDVEARYFRPEFLVLDAIEEKSDTPAQQQMLVRLVNKRLMAEKLTLLISNDDGATLPDRIGRSLTDRLNDGGGVINCNWPSLRGRI